MAGLFGENRILWEILLWTIVAVPVFGYFYRKEYRLNGKKVPDLQCLFWLFAVGVICSAGFRLAFAALGISGYEQETGALFEGGLLMQCLVLLIASPLWEELFFRGVLFVCLKKHFSLRCAAVVSALCFGLYHGNLSQGVYAFFMGILLAAAMERYKNIAAPLVIHVGANAAALILELVK